jgi:acetyl esterase/lipase
MDRRRLSMTSFSAALVSACSPLSAFNTLSPHDAAARAGRNIAYGPDPRQSLDVYTPKQGAQAAPILLFFYGGSWSSGRRQDYAFAGRALASRGFVAVVADYRLYPQARYPDFLNDCAMAVRWARDHGAQYGGDPRRIVLAGHSAGAYNAVMLALDGAFLSAAGVEPGAIRAVAGLSGPYYFLPLQARSTTDAFGQYPDLPATQPARYVSAASPPMFFGHGEKDALVKPNNSVGLGRKLDRAGVAAEVKIYPGLGHIDPMLALSRAFRGKAPVLDDLAAFLHAHSSV